jgi:hypothetical protein
MAIRKESDLPTPSKDIAMNTKTLITIATAAIALLGAASAFAQEGFTELPGVDHSTLTRAEVQAEALRARATGLIAFNDHEQVLYTSGMGKTRAQVVAETLAARRVGAISNNDRLVELTPAQAEAIEMAGQQAVHLQMAAR